jgi:FKBP-type peptidyl-prolyl cis-trans isomerase
MKVGGKARIVCPASIAYGDTGKPPSVPPKSTLIFDVELLAIEPAQK